MKKHKKTTKRRVKKEFNKKLFVFIFLAIAIFGFILFTRSSQKELLPNLLSSTTPTPTLDSYVSNSKVSYLPDYKGKKALLVTASGGSYEIYDPNKARLIFESNPESNDSGDYNIDQNLIKNPIELINKPIINGEIISFIVNGENIYFSTLNTGSQGGGSSTSLYKLNLNTKKPELLWTNWLDSTRYDRSEGAAEIEDIDGDYILISMHGCTGCDGGEAGKLIINLKNMKEKYIRTFMIDNVKLNVREGKITYQKMYPTKIKCEEVHYERGWDCEGGMTTVDQASGEVLSVPLP